MLKKDAYEANASLIVAETAVFIEGTLKGQLSVAADNNIDVTWNLTYNSGTAGTDLLGLIANNYIEIWPGSPAWRNHSAVRPATGPRSRKPSARF